MLIKQLVIISFNTLVASSNLVQPKSLNVRNDCLALITIKYDSMEPTWQSDDLILIYVRRSHLENNSLYVLQLDNELVVKRIQRKMNGYLIVKSDNPR
ncbi:MAG: S24 family peptidase [Nitrosomonas sp.]|nr:S24 family peptidase [Nitrosomonas sp.]